MTEPIELPFCLRCECMTTLSYDQGLICPCVQRGKLPKLVNIESKDGEDD